MHNSDDKVFLVFGGHWYTIVSLLRRLPPQRNLSHLAVNLLFPLSKVSSSRRENID